jgi:hypothetical protein
MSAIVEFQKRLLSDRTARAEFAANPKKFLDDLGIKLPEGMKVPNKIDPEVVEASISDVADSLTEENIRIENIDRTDPNEVIRTIEDMIPARTRDLVAAKAIHGKFGHVGDAATVAVVGAVVAAVVAVPVATFGRSAEAVSRINPAAGIEKVSRGALGITIHGPNALRIEGLSVNEVATLIKSVR